MGRRSRKKESGPSKLDEGPSVEPKSKDQRQDEAEDHPSIPPVESSELSAERWIAFCEWVERNGGEIGSLLSSHVLRRVGVNAPVVLAFVLLCSIMFLADYCSLHNVAKILAVKDRFKTYNPLSWIRLFSHCIVHSDYQHLKANIVHLLLVGPTVERAFGSRSVLIIIGIVSLATAMSHIAMSSHNALQMGASPICFSLILLNSLVSASTGTIPLSFLITAVLWISDEVWRLFFPANKMDAKLSHHAHLVGAACGFAYGYVQHRKQVRKRVSRIAHKWLESVRESSPSKKTN